MTGKPWGVQGVFLVNRNNNRTCFILSPKLPGSDRRPPSAMLHEWLSPPDTLLVVLYTNHMIFGAEHICLRRLASQEQTPGTPYCAGSVLFPGACRKDVASGM